ncbi:MAG TPA: efflux RND transporter periplasmic adaptor subunit [Thermoanaerobaculia bacterium]|nr:efflux RND transporter periplasmic adaptor subunit [Thermoanaerobaculia bacterium]
MSEEPDTTAAEEPAEGAFAAALAELLACETLAQTCGWAARWLQGIPGADAALLWTPDTVQPVFTCTGASGDGVGRPLRRSVPRGDGFVRRLIRDHEPFALSAADLLVTEDPWLAPFAKSFGACLALPLEAEGNVIGVAAVLFTDPATDVESALGAVSEFVPDAANAIARSLRQDKKTAGMLHAIERLTNLYDLSKAFGSTIEWDELNAIIARKAVDFGNAEIASLWILEGDEGEISLAATAVNENYEIEGAPEAVGAPIIADLVTSREEMVDNEVEDPMRSEHAPYEIRSLLAVPLVEDEAPVGGLVVVNKRGRHPRFSDDDRELLVDLGHQAVRALRNARRYLAEKKVEELDALLAVSREITSTLDLDRVMGTVVNATSALIAFDRCALSIVSRGKLRLGAVSGAAEINRADPSIRRIEELLEWVYGAGHPVSVRREEDGSIAADRPETEEKFRAYFDASGMNSFHAAILQDEEGKLGVIGFEAAEPIEFDEDARDLLQIVVNQATVALRNAQLYQQVPLAGFWKPLLEKRRKLAAIPGRKKRAWAIGAAVAAVILVAVPWRIRIEGPVRILPAREASVSAPIPGVVRSVLRREGDRVAPGDVVAVLHSDAFAAGEAQAKSDLEIAQSELARARADNDAAAMFQAQARVHEAEARWNAAREQLSDTELRSPVAGVIVTPHLDEKQGVLLPAGTPFCAVADASAITGEIAIPESETGFLRAGEPVDLKLNAFPTRTFHGTVERIGAAVHQEGEERFLVVEARFDNPGSAIRPGMLGKGKVVTQRHSLGFAVFRKPARYLWARLWPLFP